MALSDLQDRPFGTSSSLGPYSPGGSGPLRSLVTNEKERAKDYQRANSLLRRAARRGDVDAAEKLVTFGNMAAKAGFPVSGIRSAEENVAGAMSRISARNRQTDLMNQAAQGNRAAMAGGGGGGGGVGGGVGGAGGGGGGVGGTEPKKALSFDEQDQMKRDALTRAGAFGRGAQASDLRSRVLDQNLSVADFKNQGASIGGSEESLQKITDERNALETLPERRAAASELKSNFLTGNVNTLDFTAQGAALGGSEESLQKIVDERDIERQRALDKQKTLDNAATLKEINRKKRNEQILNEARLAGEL